MTMLLFLLFLLGAQQPGRPVNGAIEGQVRHINGRAAAGIRIAAVPIESDGATPSLSNVTQTDKSGRYRLEGIPPGRYWVLAGSLARPTYYPGVIAGQQPVTVASGARITTLDFTIRPISYVSAPVNAPGFGVTGIVTMDDGSPLPLTQPAKRFGGPDGDLIVPDKRQLAVQIEVNGDPRTLSETRALSEANIATIPIGIPFRRGENVVTVPQLPFGYYVKSMTYGDVDLMTSPLVLPGSGIIEVILTRTRPASLPPGVKVSGKVSNRPFPSRIETILVLSVASNGGPPLVGQVPAITLKADSFDGSFAIDGVLPGRYLLTLSGNSPASRLEFEVGLDGVRNLEFK